MKNYFIKQHNENFKILAPLKSDGTIYDAIRESDDDDYDSNDDNTTKKKTTKSKVNTQSAPVSPKQVQQQQQQQQNNKGQETINLLKTSMLTSQKKSPKPVTSHRKIETELEQALTEVYYTLLFILKYKKNIYI